MDGDQQADCVDTISDTADSDGESNADPVDNSASDEADGSKDRVESGIL